MKKSNASQIFEASITWSSVVLVIVMIGMLANAMADFNQTMDRDASRNVSSIAAN